jgi:RNA polymerase sigma-70 factor (ECF subfamily)
MTGAPQPIESGIVARSPLEAALRRFFGKRVPPQDVDDLVQDLFVGLLSRRRTGEIEDVRRYVFAAAANLLRKRALKQRGLAHPPCEPVELVSQITPERILLQRDELRRVQRAIEGLPARSREILLLHRFEDMTYATIAKGFGISTSAVEKHMILALKTIRAAVEPRT